MKSFEFFPKLPFSFSIMARNPRASPSRRLLQPGLLLDDLNDQAAGTGLTSVPWAHSSRWNFSSRPFWSNFFFFFFFFLSRTIYDRMFRIVFYYNSVFAVGESGYHLWRIFRRYSFWCFEEEVFCKVEISEISILCCLRRIDISLLSYLTAALTIN